MNDCPFFKDDYGGYPNYEHTFHCSIRNHCCDQNIPQNCHLFNKIEAVCNNIQNVVNHWGIGKKRRFLKHISDADLELFHYCYNRLQQRENYGHLFDYAAKIIGFWLMKKCRTDKKCPYKALLPEMEFIE